VFKLNLIDSKQIISNGIIWLYLNKNEAHLFSLGIWLLSYRLQDELSIGKTTKIRDFGNKVILHYNEGIQREVSLTRNQLIDKSSQVMDVKVIPAFSNSLIFRGDEKLPKIITPIKQVGNTITRSGYPSIVYTNKSKELVIDCNFKDTITDDSYYLSFSEFKRNKCPTFNFTTKEFSKLFNNSLRSLYKLRLQTTDGEIKAAGFPDFPSLFGRDFALSALGEIYLWPDIVEQEIMVHLKHIGSKKTIARNEMPGRAIHEFNYDIETISNKYKHFPSWYANDANSLLLITMFRLARIAKKMDLIEQNTQKISDLFQHILTLDLDQDGLLEYSKHPDQLLIHQTWRDGGDEIRYPDDGVVPHPIAPLHDQLCFYGALNEIEAYLNANKKSKLVQFFKVSEIKKQKEKLGQLINDKYWMPKLNSYALALDGSNKQVKVVNSDVCLGYYFNVFDESKAQLQYEVLVDLDRLLDLVGLRTVSKEHPHYSPKKYQRGGVWPWQLAIALTGVRKFELNIEPFLDCLRNLSKEESLAEVYMPDNKKPVPLTYCLEQRWSSAILWLVLVEGILGHTFYYDDKKPNLERLLNSINM
jgi:glycogen debranching enzyme